MSWDLVFNGTSCLNNKSKTYFILNIVQWIRVLAVHITWACELKNLHKMKDRGNFLLSFVTLMGF